MVIKNEEAFSKLKEGVDLICDVVKATFGPKGKNIILFDGMDKPFMTKDGISVAKSVKSDDIFVQAAVEIIRQASEKTATLAGDGTTCSSILAQAFFTEGLEAMKKGTYNMLQIKREFTTVLPKIVEMIKQQAHPVEFNQESLSIIATTSANNDKKIGDLVAEAYIKAGKEGTVKADLEEGFNTYIEALEGSNFPVGIALKEFFNSDSKSEASYEDVNILLYDNSVKDLNAIKLAMIASAKQGRPLAIFAHDFSELALSQLYTNHVQNVIHTIPIRVAGYSGHRKDLLKDICAAVGGEVYNTLKPSQDVSLGYCHKLTSNLYDTIVMREDTRPELELLMKNLKSLVESEHSIDIKTLYEKRLNQLKGNIVTIYVGGITQVEAKEKFDRIEDAICAVKAAVEEGIVEGGGKTLAYISEQLTEAPLVKECLWAPFKQLCSNSYLSFEECKKYVTKNTGFNFLTEKPCDLLEEGIVDPAKVIRLCVENSISVAYALLTTEGIVY